MKKVILFIACVLVFPAEGISQDVHFSQFENPTAFLNPAMTGMGNGFRAGLQYRDQWSAVDKTFRTGLFHADGSILSDNNAYLGIGGYAWFDRAGAASMNQTEAALQLSGVVRVGNGMRLSAGIKAAFAQTTVNPDNLTWDNQFDGSGYNASLASGELFSQDQVSFFDFGAGIGFTYESSSNSVNSRGNTLINVGIAAHHLTQPDETFLSGGEDKLPMRFTVHGDSRFIIAGTKFGVEPAFQAHFQGQSMNVVVGSGFRFGLGNDSKYTGFLSSSALGAGLYYRIGDAMIPTIKFETQSLVFGMSYDVTASGLSNYIGGRGGWEISILVRNIGDLFGGTSGRSMM